MTNQGSEEFELIELKTTRFRICEGPSMARISDNFRVLLDYFKEKTGGERLARRDEIDLLDLPDLIPQICIFDFERNAQGEIVDALMRLQGSKIADSYKSVMGKSVREQNFEEISERIFFLSNRISKTKKPIVALAGQPSEEKFYMAMAVLYLPLSDDNITVNSTLLYIETR